MARYNPVLAEDCACGDHPEIPRDMGDYMALVCGRCGSQVDTMPK